MGCCLKKQEKTHPSDNPIKNQELESLASKANKALEKPVEEIPASNEESRLVADAKEKSKVGSDPVQSNNGSGGTSLPEVKLDGSVVKSVEDRDEEASKPAKNHSFKEVSKISASKAEKDGFSRADAERGESESKYRESPAVQNLSRKFEENSQPQASPSVKELSRPHQEVSRSQGKESFNLKSCLQVLNDIRSDPKKYSDRIDTLYLDHIDSRGVNRQTNVVSNEGREVFVEAKNYLAEAQPIRPMKLNYGLTAAALLHSEYMGEVDQLTHEGRDSSDIEHRFTQYGKYMSGYLGENILFRYNVDYERWILDFIIDDGVPNRGHRENIFNDKFTQVGLGIAKTGSKWFFTMDFASGGYTANPETIDECIKDRSGLTLYEREITREQSKA